MYAGQGHSCHLWVGEGGTSGSIKSHWKGTTQQPWGTATGSLHRESLTFCNRDWIPNWDPSGQLGLILSINKVFRGKVGLFPHAILEHAISPHSTCSRKAPSTACLGTARNAQPANLPAPKNEKNRLFADVRFIFEELSMWKSSILSRHTSELHPWGQICPCKRLRIWNSHKWLEANVCRNLARWYPRQSLVGFRHHNLKFRLNMKFLAACFSRGIVFRHK